MNTKKISQSIECLLLGQNHREITDQLISEEFLFEAVEFFKRVVEAKLNQQSVDLNWYQKTFIEDESDKTLIASNAGLAIKTINNKRNTTKREVVIEESLKSLDKLRLILNDLNELCESELEIELSITFNHVTVRLNLSESLLVINALAVRRQQIRGGMWSSLGKQIETPLLEIMCVLFEVPNAHYSPGNRKELREVDFLLYDQNKNPKRCEVKLQGKGNPEGADSVHARSADVFVAGTLSETNIKQLDSKGIEWVQLSQPRGFLKFGNVLETLNVPHRKLSEETHTNEKDLETYVKNTVNGYFMKVRGLQT